MAVLRKWSRQLNAETVSSVRVTELLIRRFSTTGVEPAPCANPAMLVPETTSWEVKAGAQAARRKNPVNE